MSSLRRKIYTTYLLIIISGGIGLQRYAEKFRELPSFYGVDIYSVLLGFVFLVISIILLEFFVFTRIRYVNKDLERIKRDKYRTDRQIVDLSKNDEIGQLVGNLNEALEQLHQEKEKLKLKSSLYLSLVEDASIYVYRFKESGEITFVNKAYASAMGRNYKEMIRKNIFNYLLNENEMRKKLSLLNPVNPSSSISLDMPKIVGKKKPEWIAWTACAVFNEYGKAIEYQVVGVDMHASKNNNKFSYDNTYVLNDLGKVAYLTDIERYENIVGMPFAQIVHEGDRGIFMKAFKQVASYDYPFSVRNIRVLRRDSYVPVQILIEASRDKENKLSSVVVKMIDISDIEGAQAKVVGAVNNMNRLLEGQKI